MLTAVPTIAVFPEEKLTQSQKVEKWTWQLCRALEENYEQYHRRMITNNSKRYSGNREDLSDYAKQQLAEMDNGTAKLMKFRMEFGRKYIKIIQQDYRDANEYYHTGGGYRDGSVHAFINKETGQVYKPASWKSPAKHVRYDLRVIRDREYVLNPDNCGWAGGYLYMR